MALRLSQPRYVRAAGTTYVTFTHEGRKLGDAERSPLATQAVTFATYLLS